MYCDANGRPDPNGDYQLINGKKILRDGRAVRFDALLMRDSAAPSQVFLKDASTHFTDAERQLADSDEGRLIVTRAKGAHYRKHAYLGDRAPAFTDAQAAAAIRLEAGQKQSTQAILDLCAMEEAVANGQLAEARRQRAYNISSRYRNG